MLPAHQLCHGHVITIRLQLQAAQYVADLAAKLARVQRMPPQLGQRRFAHGQRLVSSQDTGYFGLAAGHQHHVARVLGKAEGNRVVSGGVAGMQRGHDVYRRRQIPGRGGLCHQQV